MKEDKDEKTGSNVSEGDRATELPCKDCGSKMHKTSDHKKGKGKYEEKKKALAEKKA